MKIPLLFSIPGEADPVQELRERIARFSFAEVPIGLGSNCVSPDYAELEYHRGWGVAFANRL